MEKLRQLSRAQIGIGSGVIILVIFILFVKLFITDLFYSLCWGTIFGAIVYFIFVFPYVSFVVPAGWAWLMSDSFKQESSEKIIKFSGFRKIVAQTEFQAGFHWKYPWETKAYEVSMNRNFIIEGEDGDVYTFKGGEKLIKIKWQVAVVPLPGNIKNYRKTPEAEIEIRVKNKVKAFIQGYIGDLKGTKIDFGSKGREEFKKSFEEVYGGQEIIDEIDERPMGIWTGTPEIVKIDELKGAQDAKIFQQVVDSVIQTAEEMVKKSNGKMPFGSAMHAAYILYAAEKGGKVDVLQLAGKLFGK